MIFHTSGCDMEIKCYFGKMFEIIDGLYQGPAPSSDIVFDSIINLMNENESRLVKKPFGMKYKIYLNIPFADGVSPGIDWLIKSAAIVEKLLETGNVLVHCRGGISRSAMLVAATYMKKNNIRNHEEALNFVASKNPNIDPAPCFVQLLKQYGTTFK